MIIELKDLKLKIDLFKSLYEPNFINIRYFYRYHWYKNTEKNYSQLLLLLNRVNKV